MHKLLWGVGWSWKIVYHRVGGSLEIMSCIVYISFLIYFSCICGGVCVCTKPGHTEA